MSYPDLSNSINHPEFKRGWRVLAAAAIGTACGASQIPLNILGAIVPDLEAEFGWGRGQIQLAFLYFTLAGALTFPIGGYLMDRFGARPVALVATFLFGASFAAIALSPPSLMAFYALWALCGVLGGGSTPVSWTRTVNGWFVKRRGLALAITLTASAILAFGVVVGSSYIVAHPNMTWRSVFGIFALLPLLVALPIAYLWFKEPPQEVVAVTGGGKGKVAPGLTFGEALLNYRFWVMLVIIILVSMSAIGIIVNIRPLLSDQEFTAEMAAYVAGSIALSVAFGRMITGYLIDRYWAPIVVFPMLLLPAVACLLLAQVEVTIPAAFTAAILVGLAAGAESDVMAYLTVRYFGIRNYGLLFGFNFAVFAVAAGVAPGLFGWVYDSYHSYAYALYGAAAAFVVAALLMLTLGKYPVFAADSSEQKD